MDGTEKLCKILYSEEKADKYLGGSNAQMLHDAADRLEEKDQALRVAIGALFDFYEKDFLKEFSYNELKEIINKTDNENLKNRRVEEILKTALNYE